MSTPRCPETLDARRDAALRFLYDRIDYERAITVPFLGRDFKLDRMVDLLARLGDPQEKLPIIHVAGTKGKGSTSAMIGAILTAAGRRTGVFTSPHLERIEERMAIDGKPCTAEEFVDLVHRIQPAVLAIDRQRAARDPAEIGPTYFEITTAMALLHFAKRKAEAVVLEVGMGGRLDSTNVCRPRVAVITSISFDHMKQLGHTLEAIAQEKAGIIKPGVPVVSGVIDTGPRDVIRRVCAERAAPLVELGVDFTFRYSPPRHLESAAAMATFDYSYTAAGRSREYHALPLRLIGEHQAANAAACLAALGMFQAEDRPIPEQAIRDGLAGVAWPARIEVVARRPVVVVDAAHNLASVDALVHVLEESFSVRRRLLVFATTQEKDLRGMLSRLEGHFDHVIFTRYLSNPRAVPAEELMDLWREQTGQEAQLCPDPASAWDAVRRLASPDDLIAITGSFFIAAEMRAEIRDRPAGQNLAG